MGGVIGSVTRAAVIATVITRIVPIWVTISVAIWGAVAVISIWISPVPAPAPPPRKAEAADEDEPSIVETAEAIATIIDEPSIVETVHPAASERLPASRRHRSEIVAAATARSSCDY